MLKERSKTTGLRPYQIDGVDMNGNTVSFPKPPWDLEQLPIPIFVKPGRVSFGAK